MQVSQRMDGTGGGQGLTGWMLGMLRTWRGGSAVQRKQMHLVETLSLGGKRQLMLVSCGGETFLVGGGMESVETIVQVKLGVRTDEMVENQDHACV